MVQKLQMLLKNNHRTKKLIRKLSAGKYGLREQIIILIINANFKK